MASGSEPTQKYLAVHRDNLKFEFQPHTTVNRYRGSVDAPHVSFCCGVVFSAKEALQNCPLCPEKLDSLVACVSCKRVVGGEHACTKCNYIACAICLGEDDSTCHGCRGVPLPEPGAQTMPHSEYHVRTDFPDTYFGPQARFVHGIMDHPLDTIGTRF